jgi:hypothetical protein
MTMRIALFAMVVNISGKSSIDASLAGMKFTDDAASFFRGKNHVLDELLSSSNSWPVPPSKYSRTCEIWLAPSTIPGAGLGMYAGRAFKKGESLLYGGDLVVPIVDIFQHAEEASTAPWAFLWTDYSWNGNALRMGSEGLFDISGASPGLGAASNCFFDIINFEESGVTLDPAGLHRSKDPGAGAFTQYHGRISSARLDIDAGSELFVSYGDNWFESRSHLAAVPLSGGVSIVVVSCSLQCSCFSLLTCAHSS